MSNNVEQIDTIYGKMFVLNTDINQYESLRNTGKSYHHQMVDFVVSKHNPKNGMFLDVGANFGIFSLAVAKAHEDARIMAFECQQEIYRLLAMNFVENVHDGIAMHMAIGDDNCDLLLPMYDYSKRSNFGSVSLITEAIKNPEYIGQYPQGFVEVTCHTLDFEVDGDPVDFIKIDVEGMEEEVIAGAYDVIMSNHPKLLIEHLKSDKDNLYCMLEDMGYNTYTEYQNDIYCERI